MARLRSVLPCALALMACAPLAAHAQSMPEAAAQLAGTLPSGAKWTAQVPKQWNGTLLLWSRGYSPTVGTPEAAARGTEAALLEAGYALLGSDYGSGGWALAEAVPAQRAAVAAFKKAHRKPKRVIAWGYSMGGLVSTALAEDLKPVVHGALSMCSSMGGAIGMMNMGLDGAYSFRTLIAPDAGLQLVNIDDDRANAGRLIAALKVAMETPEGRARVALAGVLAGLPGWSTADQPEPAADDVEKQTAEIARAFPMGVFLPRVDQESRAGGAFSWNDGVDYVELLNRSERRAMVEAMYQKAGLNLDEDLARLNAGERVTAKANAIEYMMQHYTPNAQPKVPVLAVQMKGDGLTSPALQRFYADAAKGGDVQSLYINNAGHCNFTPEQVVTSVRYLDQRVATRKWSAAPALFTPHTPPPMMRGCVRGKDCR